MKAERDVADLKAELNWLKARRERIEALEAEIKELRAKLERLESERWIGRRDAAPWPSPPLPTPYIQYSLPGEGGQWRPAGIPGD